MTSLDRVATELQSAQLAQSEMVDDYLLKHAYRPDMTQERVNRATREFADLSNAIMPTDVIGGYIRTRCDTQPLTPLNKTRPGEKLLFLPGWGTHPETGEPSLPEDPTIEDRKAALYKFTAGEHERCMRILRVNPDLLVALRTLQRMIGTYFQELADKIPEERADVRKMVHAMGFHWSHGANFNRMILMAIVVATKDLPVGKVFDQLTQEHVNEAIDLLVRSGSFGGGDAYKVNDIKFACPVQTQVRDVFCEQGCFMEVVKKLRGLRSQADIATYVQSRGAIEQAVRNMEPVMAEGAEAFDEMGNSFTPSDFVM